MSRNMLNGAQVIVDYLIQKRCRRWFWPVRPRQYPVHHALYERSADIKMISVHYESVAGFAADVYYRVSGRPTATFTLRTRGSANLPILLGNNSFSIRVHGGDRQCADPAVQSRRVPGIVPAPS